MDVITTSGLPVSSLVWQLRPGGYAFTVVCCATYTLRPGECALAPAPAQESPAEDERHHDDDASRSVRRARDLVPVKPSVDVMVTGHAYAPERRPARSLIARVSVAELDKSIEVFAERSLGHDGVVREGQPFTQMPLVYERAAGGPGTNNPVGIRRDARFADGSLILPNLQKPGASPHAAFEPVGLGPIAPGWPERRDRLGAAGAGWSLKDIGQRPLPEGMDLGFFNAAPRDQQLRSLGERPRLVLENLHPEHARLTTTIPLFTPRAVLEGRREGPQALSMRADSLWIDTDRGLCVVTYRGTVPLHAAGEKARVVVSVDGAAGPAPARPAVDPGVRARLGATADIPLAARMGAALPFAPSQSPSPAPSPAPPSPPVVAPAPVIIVPVALDSAPQPVAPTPPLAPSLGASPSPPASPWAPRPGAADLPSLGALAVAARPEPRPMEPLPPPSEPEPAPTPRPEIRESVELVWFDPECVPRVRRKAIWKPLLDALERTPPDPDLDDPAFAKDPMSIEERREVFEVLARGEARSPDDLQSMLAQCLRDDGKLVPTLALLAGELELPFDELSALRATITTVTPLMQPEETALKNAVTAGKEFLATPGLMSAPAVAEGLTKRIEEAFAQGKRVVAAGYLEAQRERALLEQRQYQRRSVLGGKHLRGLLRGDPPAAKQGTSAKAPPAANNPPAPAYLPESLAEELPLFSRFRVRILAEVRMSADRYEAHPAALKVLALARLAPPPKAPT